jgi:hypothetical protein
MKARAKCMPWLQKIISVSFNDVQISCCFHGAPQLLKLARNYLVDQGFILNPSSPKPEQEVAIVEPLLQQLLENIPGRDVPDVPLQKVTQHHLTCGGCDRRSIQLATKVLSQQTAVALEEAGKKKWKKSVVINTINTVTILRTKIY